MSGVSVRTIQRFEKTGNAASPFVVRALCKALEIDVDALEIADDKTILEITPVSGNLELKFVNFSALLVVLFPLLNILAPSVLYLMTRKKMQHRTHALKILSFQLLWTFAALAAILASAVVSAMFGITEIARQPLFVWVYVAAVVINVGITLRTAARISASSPVLPGIPNIL